MRICELEQHQQLAGKDAESDSNFGGEPFLKTITYFQRSEYSSQNEPEKKARRSI